MSARSESEPVVTVTSLALTPNFFFAASRPAAAESLKDLSPRPPRSYARPTFTFDFAAARAKVVAMAAQYGLEIDPDVLVEELGVGAQEFDFPKAVSSS